MHRMDNSFYRAPRAECRVFTASCRDVVLHVPLPVTRVVRCVSPGDVTPTMSSCGSLGSYVLPYVGSCTPHRVYNLVAYVHEKDARTVRDSIMVSIPRCHRGDRGSIPRRGRYFFDFACDAYTMHRMDNSFYRAPRAECRVFTASCRDVVLHVPLQTVTRVVRCVSPGDVTPTMSSCGSLGSYVCSRVSSSARRCAFVRRTASRRVY